MKYREFWLYYFKPTNMLFAFEEIQQIKRQHPENFKETHVIEYQAYEKLQKQNEKLKDALKIYAADGFYDFLVGQKITEENSKLVYDLGKTAREALKKIEER